MGGGSGLVMQIIETMNRLCIINTNSLPVNAVKFLIHK